MPINLRSLPSKIIAVGLNYHNHAKELKLKTPRHPIIFLKPSTALIKNNDKIIIPKMSKRVDYEAELALIIKKKGKDIPKNKVKGYIKGFTCLNDVTARDLQFKDNQWTRAKSFDTFCPVGPRTVPWTKDLNPNNLKIECRLNGKVVQKSNTKEFIFKIEQIVSFISKIMTLLPGDIITTGTPPGIGKMKKGDIVEVEIEKIGILRNYVISYPG